MLTQQPSASPAPETAPAKPRETEDLIAYFEGEYVPLRDAKVSIMTHAFMYGTATFEGIRAYWNAEQGVLYGLKLREHVERIRQSCRILLMENVPSVDELTGFHAIRVNDQYRIIFRFDGGHAVDVRCADYH